MITIAVYRADMLVSGFYYAKKKRSILPNAIAGMTAGGTTTIIWKYLSAPLGGAFGIYRLMPAFLTGLIAIIVVSLMTKGPSQEIEQEFEMAKSDKVLQN